MARTGVPDAAELAAIAGGALPSAARDRLEALVGLAPMSTSFLAVGEEALGAGLGVLALGQVIGCCGALLRHGVLRAVGPGASDRHRPGQARWLERSGIVETWTEARLRATRRLQAQAEILGADAVVGVRTARRQDAGAAEVVLSGTAVRIDAPSRPAGQPRPLVTTASVGELAKLRAAGARPVGLVGGCASVAAEPSSATIAVLGRRRRARRSHELAEFTFAFGETRRRAIARLRTEAAQVGAGGVIGIGLEDLEEFRGGGGDYHAVLHVLGMAIARGSRPPGSPVGTTLRVGPGAR